MKISMIAAVAHNNVLGADNKIPWHMPKDFQYFKRMTMGKPIIMGRKTFASLGKPLPGRHNIVMTTQQDFNADDCTIVHTPEQALAACGNCEEAMVIGGAEIYQLFLDQADRIYLTEITLDCHGDTFFPEFDKTIWEEVQREPQASDEKNPHPYSFVIYEKTIQP